MAGSTRERLTREQQRERTLARLLEAAEELFAERGIAETSIEEIAEHAGYSRGAFYSNFADKDALVIRLIEEQQKRSIAETNAIAESTSDPDEFLAALFEWSRNLSEVRSRLGIEYILFATSNTEGRPRVKELNDGLLTQHAALVQQQFDSLEVEMPLSPEEAAKIMLGLDEGFALLRLVDPERFPHSMWSDTVGFLNEAVLALAEKRAREAEA